MLPNILPLGCKILPTTEPLTTTYWKCLTIKTYHLAEQHRADISDTNCGWSLITLFCNSKMFLVQCLQNIGDTLRVLRSGFDSRQGQEISLYSKTSTPALGPTQPPVNWPPGALSLGVKRPERENDDSPTSITDGGAISLFPHMSSWYNVDNPAYKTTSTIKHHLKPRGEPRDIYNQSGVYQLQCSECPLEGRYEVGMYKGWAFTALAPRPTVIYCA
jgi:hypothetical protein